LNVAKAGVFTPAFCYIVLHGSLSNCLIQAKCRLTSVLFRFSFVHPVFKQFGRQLSCRSPQHYIALQNRTGGAQYKKKKRTAWDSP